MWRPHRAATLHSDPQPSVTSRSTQACEAGTTAMHVVQLCESLVWVCTDRGIWRGVDSQLGLVR
jgi:hypothetical protein